MTAWIESFFFYPDNAKYSTPAQFGIVAEDVWLRAPDGSRLHAWFLPVSKDGAAHGTVLHLHGNAANVSNHLPLVEWLPARGFNVLTLDYRGFGRSEGRPSLSGVVDDAAAALAYLRMRPDVDAQRLVVWGQSLGGATALRLLARDAGGVRLGVIEAAFTSYRAIARDAAAGSPLALIAPLAAHALPPPADDPIAALARIRIPLIFVHGTRDSLISPSHSEALRAAAPGSQLWLVPDGDHVTSLYGAGPWRERLLKAMLDAVAKIGVDK